MAPKHDPKPLSGGDRKALQKELGKARDHDRAGADGEPIDASPTVDQAIDGGDP